MISLQKNKMTTIMITHDLDLAVEYSDRIIMLDHGKVVLDVRKGEISSRELRNIYYDKINQGLQKAS